MQWQQDESSQGLVQKNHRDDDDDEDAGKIKISPPFKKDTPVLLASLSSFQKADDTRDDDVCYDNDSNKKDTPSSSSSSSSSSVVLVWGGWLSDDIMGNILEYCDTRSAVTLCYWTCRALRHQQQQPKITPISSTNDSCDQYYYHWFKMFQRHGFSPEGIQEVLKPVPSKTKKNGSSLLFLSNPWIPVLLERRQLFCRFMDPLYKKRRRQQQQSQVAWSTTKATNTFHSLPQEHFSFLPLVSSSLSFLGEELVQQHQHFHDDGVGTPPIFYECDSMVCLTSTATSPELFMLHPVDGSVTVLPNLLSHVEKEQENPFHHSLEYSYESENKTNSMIADKERNSKGKKKKKPLPASPSAAAPQILLSAEDYFDVDLSDYFWIPNPEHQQQQEFEVVYLGVDAKPIWNQKTSKTPTTTATSGTMVGLGRMVHPVRRQEWQPILDANNNHTNHQNVNVCTEFVTWTKHHKKEQQGKSNVYGDRKVCRVPFIVDWMDWDACHDRLYVQPATPQHQVQASHGCQIWAYPLHPRREDDDGFGQEEPTQRSPFFAEPIFSIDCHVSHPATDGHDEGRTDSVAALALDATGDRMVVATSHGQLQIWKLPSATFHNSKNPASRLECLTPSIAQQLQMDIHECLRCRKHKTGEGSTIPPEMDEGRTESGSNNRIQEAAAAAAQQGQHALSQQHHDRTDDDEEDYRSLAVALQGQPDLPHFQTGVKGIYLSKHASIEQAGFVTFHHSVGGDGVESLLLWQNNDAKYQIVSLINIPLSPWKRTPRIWYDGNRLIVFGQDSIGCIILLYQILRNPEFQATTINKERMGEEASGGVYNLQQTTTGWQVRLANRIRHVALGNVLEQQDGGLSLDSLQLTCNERFLIVNTRTGNLLGSSSSSSPSPEGLFVIDLLPSC